MGRRAARLSMHLKKYVLLYLLITITVALLIGYKYVAFFKSNRSLVRDLILSLAILTIFPSMVQLRVERIGSAVRGRALFILIVLAVIFAFNPLISISLASLIHQKEIAIGCVAANVVPASSASIAYAMIAEGSVEIATVLVTLSILIAIPVAPIYVGLYARNVSVSLPISALAESVLIALLTPLVLGQLTRYLVVKRGARRACASLAFPDGNRERYEECIKSAEGRISSKVKPYLSILTLCSLFSLVFMLIASKAHLLVQKPWLGFKIIALQLIVYASTIGIMLALTKASRMGYEEHMGSIFIVLTRNESVAAAMAIMSIGVTAAIPAALIPTIQPVVAMGYLSMSKSIRRLVERRRS